LLRHVRLSAGMEQHGSEWMDFHEIRYLNIIRHSVDNIQVSLKSDKNNGQFAEGQCTLFSISRRILLSTINV
jgi:hypothetical protein